jgi:tRNA-Thr(GGU) m(6)t(6)A37 methyltransferase TsaA
MMKKTDNQNAEYHVYPIGVVQGNKKKAKLVLDERYRPALAQLGHFSHLIVLWWAHKRDSEVYRTRLQTKPPYAKDKLTGIFATRAEYRPNPIGVTTCRILKVDEDKGVVEVVNLDAVDGTPILDLKGYFPVCDRVKEASIPEWLSYWPEWVPE